jgi:hypothetical protein
MGTGTDHTAELEKYAESSVYHYVTLILVPWGTNGRVQTIQKKIATVLFHLDILAPATYLILYFGIYHKLINYPLGFSCNLLERSQLYLVTSDLHKSKQILFS